MILRDLILMRNLVIVKKKTDILLIFLKIFT
jgi:hypothetical protein